MKTMTLLLFVALAGCNYSVDHEVRVALDLEDECLTAFPMCTEHGDYYCVFPDESLALDCDVNCILADTRTCSATGPECTQLGENVPVFCMESR